MYYRRCEAGLRSSLLQQMQVLIRMLKRSMVPYLSGILKLVVQCWAVSVVVYRFW